MSLKLKGSFGPITGAMKTGDATDAFNLITSSSIYLDVDNYTSGTTWFDQSGNNNNATLENVSFSSGHLNYNGSSSRTFIPHSEDFTSTSRSMCVWIKRTDGANHGVVLKAGMTFYFDSIWETKGGGGFQWTVGSAGAAEEISTSTNVWYLISFTYDATEQLVRFYRNNTLIATQSSATINNGTDQIVLGDIPHASGHEFGGSFDTFAVYNQQLTELQLTEFWDLNKTRYGY